MPKVRVNRMTSYTLDFGDFSVETEFQPYDGYGDTILHQRSGDKLVVAYLVHDEDCQNPLEDSCAMGHVIGRGKYETRSHSESELFEALGLDRYGDPDFDRVEEQVQAKWREYLDTVTDETWGQVLAALGFDGTGPYPANEMVNKLRDEMHAVIICQNPSMYYAIYEAERFITDISPTGKQVTAASDFLSFDVEKAQQAAWDEGRAAGKIGDRDAVMLDVYDHSGICWSISGQGMNCRWDTSRGAGIWVPDDELRKYLDEITDPAARYAQAVVYAGQALDEYNKWLSGDCYGCVVETYEDVGCEGEPNWEQVDQDACWGFLGQDSALETLKSEYLDPAVTRAAKETTAV